jgi:probable F420-dependent oxidoreductase
MPYWLDRPDTEAVEIARAAEEVGLDTAWVGEMASFDAFALATAVGLQTERLRLKIGPLAVGVRSPVAIALGVASVAALTGHQVDVALGASSPVIVGGWHDRPWGHLAPRTRETVVALRELFNGRRLECDGEHVRSHGFRLRRPVPGASIAIAAFGPKMTEVAAHHADEVVLNLVTPEHVAKVRGRVQEHAAAAGRPVPKLSVWVPVAWNQAGQR